MSKANGVLCLFTKAPIPGKVKTRLIPAIGEEKANELYRSLLNRTLSTACSSNFAKVRLYSTPDIEHPFLQECADKFEVELCLQKGQDLGERMSNALIEGLDEYDFSAVIGCDCPWITVDDLAQVSVGLTTKSDVVLGPAKDGGYYLLGLKSPQRMLFVDMSWGASTVLAETRRRLQAANLSWNELNEYSDIDRPEDLPAYENWLSSQLN